MSENDPLSDLGLDLGITEEQAAGTTEAKAAGAPVIVASAPAKAKAEARVEVEIGDIVVAADDDLIPLTRGGGAARESKYKFDELGAPVKREDGSFGYASFLVVPAEGEDVERVKRSVQSATTQANTKGKTDEPAKKFVTRSVVVGGKITGIKVYRVDDTLGADAE